MTKNYKIELTELLSRIDCNDYGYYDTLTEEQRKAFEPWLSMRFVSSSKSNPEHYLIFTNEIVNRDFSVLKDHPKLFWMLLCMVGVGRSKNYDHPFIKPTRKKINDKLQYLLSQVYPSMNEDELALFISVNTKEDIFELLVASGNEEKDIKKLLK